MMQPGGVDVTGYGSDRVAVSEGERTEIGARERFRNLFRGACQDFEDKVLRTPPPTDEFVAAAYGEMLIHINIATEEYQNWLQEVKPTL